MKWLHAEYQVNPWIDSCWQSQIFVEPLHGMDLPNYKQLEAPCEVILSEWNRPVSHVSQGDEYNL